MILGKQRRLAALHIREAQDGASEFVNAIASIERSYAMLASSVCEAMAVNALITAATAGLGNALQTTRLINWVAKPATRVLEIFKASLEVNKLAVTAAANATASLATASLQAICEDTFNTEATPEQDQKWTEGFAYSTALTLVSGILTDTLGSGLLKGNSSKFFRNAAQLFADYGQPTLDLYLNEVQAQYGRELSTLELEWRSYVPAGVSNVVKAQGETYMKWADRAVEDLTYQARLDSIKSGNYKRNLPFLAKHLDWNLDQLIGDRIDFARGMGGYKSNLLYLYMGLADYHVRLAFWLRVGKTLKKLDRGGRRATGILVDF